MTRTLVTIGYSVILRKDGSADILNPDLETVSVGYWAEWSRGFTADAADALEAAYGVDPRTVTVTDVRYLEHGSVIVDLHATA